MIVFIVGKGIVITKEIIVAFKNELAVESVFNNVSAFRVFNCDRIRRVEKHGGVGSLIDEYGTLSSVSAVKRYEGIQSTPYADCGDRLTGYGHGIVIECRILSVPCCDTKLACSYEAVMNGGLICIGLNSAHSACV